MAEHVPAWQEHFYVVSCTTCAAPTSHLWFPQSVFHACNLEVHALQLQDIWCLMQTFKSLFGFLYALLLGSQLFLHTGILLLCRLQSRLSLSLSHLSVLKLVFLRLNHLHLQFSLGFKLHNNLLFQGEFIPLSLQQLVHVLFLCVNGCLEFVKRYLVLLQFLLVHLEIHIVSLQLLLLRLQAPCQRVLFRPVRL